MEIPEGFTKPAGRGVEGRLERSVLPNSAFESSRTELVILVV